MKWTNFLTGFWGPRPSGATLAATPIFQAKMPKLQKSIRHMINGAHLIAIIVLSSGIFWNTILDKKWLRYWQKTYAHIWAYGPNLLFYGPHFGQIVLFFNCNNFVQLTMFNYMFIAIFSSKSIKIWILELKTIILEVFCLFLNMGFSKNKILQKPTPPTFFNVLSCKFQKVLKTLFLCYVTKLFFGKKILSRATPIFPSLDVQTSKNGRGSAQKYFFKK